MKTIFLSIAVLCIAFSSYSQKAKVQKGDKQYEQYAYIDAIKTYEAVAEKGYKSVDVFQKLGNAYFVPKIFFGNKHSTATIYNFYIE